MDSAKKGNYDNGNNVIKTTGGRSSQTKKKSKKKPYAAIATAPVYTRKDEERDLQELSNEDRLKILGDVFGSTDGNSNNEQDYIEEEDYDGTMDDIFASIIESSGKTPEELFDEFEDEIDRIQDETIDKRAYLHALEVCPELVATESNPLLFLECKDGNVSEAAIQLVKYWEFRVRIFGEVDAYLPMTLHGALSNSLNDMVTMGLNYARIIPNDVHGRTVICINSNVADPNSYETDKLLAAKYCLYVDHIAMQLETSIRNGVVLVFINTEREHFNDFDRKTNAYLIESMMVLPMKFKSMHGIANSACMKMMPQAQAMMNNYVRQRLVLHEVDRSVEDETLRVILLDKLNSFGVYLNYDWTFLDGSGRTPWLEERMIIEGIINNAES